MKDFYYYPSQKKLVIRTKSLFSKLGQVRTFKDAVFKCVGRYENVNRWETINNEEALKYLDEVRKTLDKESVFQMIKGMNNFDKETIYKMLQDDSEFMKYVEERSKE